MSDRLGLLGVFKIIGLLWVLGVSMSACSRSKSWKEEVLLHNGSTIIVDRSVEYGGRHEIGQSPPFKEQTLTFTLPNNNQRITWKDEFSDDVGSSNFNPMLLEVFGNTAYVLVTPSGCLSYNKWGRPNPPYVVFKYQNKEWKRVSLQELPTEIKLPNLVISSPDDVAKKAGYGVLSAEMIRQGNEGFGQPEYRTILREPLPESQLCPDWNSPRYRSPKAPLPMKPLLEK